MRLTGFLWLCKRQLLVPAAVQTLTRRMALTFPVYCRQEPKDPYLVITDGKVFLEPGVRKRPATSHRDY